MDNSIQSTIPVKKQATASVNISPEKLFINMLAKTSTSVNVNNASSSEETTATTQTENSSPVPEPLNTTEIVPITEEKPVENTDPFSKLREQFQQINPSQLQDIMLNNAKMLQFSSSTFYRDQGNYIESLAPITANLLTAIQNNDRNGVYNALSEAINLASNLKLKRANNVNGYNKDLIDNANSGRRIYQNILNDPNMIDLSNPQHALQFLTQTMMWTNGGSLPDYMHSLSNSVGANTIFYDPNSTFQNYNY